MISYVVAKIENGYYKGRTVKVQFGKPMKILVDGKDVTNVLVSLNIRLDVHGQRIFLELAELDYSQIPSTQSILSCRIKYQKKHTTKEVKNQMKINWHDAKTITLGMGIISVILIPVFFWFGYNMGFAEGWKQAIRFLLP